MGLGNSFLETARVISMRDEQQLKSRCNVDLYDKETAVTHKALSKDGVLGPLSIVIPVFNAELTLEELYLRLIPVVEGWTSCFEVIMVEDCGTDRSWEIIQKIVSQDDRIQGFKLSRNYGQHNALLCGIRAARYDTIVTMDDDLQHPASELKVLVDRLNEGFDVVYGSPRKEWRGAIRGIASRITKVALSGAIGLENAQDISAFRVFRKRLIKGFADYRSPNVSIDALLAWSTSSFTSVEVRYDPRYAGKSGYTLGKLVQHTLNLVTGFTTLPLRVVSVTGLIFSVFGFVVLTWVLGRYFVTGSSLPGFPFLASIIAIFSGAQLFALGICGEYLARTHFLTMGKPSYVIAQQSRNLDAEDKSTSGPL